MHGNVTTRALVAQADDDGGAKPPVDLAYVEDADILVDSGEKGMRFSAWTKRVRSLVKRSVQIPET